MRRVFADSVFSENSNVIHDHAEKEDDVCITPKLQESTIDASSAYIVHVNLVESREREKLCYFSRKNPFIEIDNEI